MASLRRFGRAEAGQTAVEFALSVTVLLIIVLGIFDLGRAVWYSNTLSLATREAVRCAIVSGPGCTGTNKTPTDVVLRYAIGVNPIPRVVTTYCSVPTDPCLSPTTASVGSYVTVSATSDFVPIASRFFLNGALNVALTGSSTLLVRQDAAQAAGPAPSRTPTTTFTGAPASAASGATFTVSSTTNASTPPVYSSSGACTNSGATYTMTSGTGTCTATVSWAGDSSYDAFSRSQTTIASKTAPTTSFTGAPASADYQQTFPVSSTTNSTSPPVYTASGGCTNNGTAYTMISGTTTCTLTVTWAEDANYSAATSTQTTTARKIAPTTTFTGAPASASKGSSFTVSSTRNSTSVPVYSTSAAPNNACTNSGATYTMTDNKGTCTSIVNWAADQNYLAATRTQTTLATK